MKKIGLITIGQTPREDVIPDIAPLFSSEVELLQAGALDGLTAQDIAMFAPQEGDYVLISRLHDGSPVVFAERHILPRLQSCIDELEARGVELILFLCTGSFPAFHSNVPLVFPCKVLNGVVPALAAHSRIAVITPKEEQKKQCGDKWNEYVSHVQVVCASPYGDSAELECACELLKETDVDLIVLDCIGYTAKMKAHVQMHTGKRVVLSRTVAARVVMELLS